MQMTKAKRWMKWWHWKWMQAYSREILMDKYKTLVVMSSHSARLPLMAIFMLFIHWCVSTVYFLTSVSVSSVSVTNLFSANSIWRLTGNQWSEYSTSELVTWRPALQSIRAAFDWTRCSLSKFCSLIPIAPFAITINSNVCPHIRVPNMLMRDPVHDVIGIFYSEARK